MTGNPRMMQMKAASHANTRRQSTQFPALPLPPACGANPMFSNRNAAIFVTLYVVRMAEDATMNLPHSVCIIFVRRIAVLHCHAAYRIGQHPANHDNDRNHDRNRSRDRCVDNPQHDLHGAIGGNVECAAQHRRHVVAPCHDAVNCVHHEQDDVEDKGDPQPCRIVLIEQVDDDDEKRITQRVMMLAMFARAILQTDSQVA